MLPAFLTTLLFSLSAVFATRSIRHFGAGPANFWRLAVAAVFLAVLAHGWGAGLSGPAFWIFFLSGCIGFGFGDIALFLAFARIGSRLTILLTQCLAAPIAGLVEWLWLGTRLTAGEWLFSAVILLGVGLALAPGSRLQVPRGVLIAGILLGIGAAFGQGLGAVVSRKAYEVSEAAGVFIDGPTAAYQRILGGITVTGLCLLALRVRTPAANPATPLQTAADPSAARQTPPPRPAPRHWGWILANGLAGPALGVSCFQWALATTPSAVVLPIVALTPIAVMPLAWKMEGDRPTLRALFGAAVAVAGAVGLSLAH
ncbi:MAG: DMT family transporter [Puniceicoccaceae bacterium]|nr:MAG: DMT family transporter [Puniceicoccaceae bacterium]